MATRGRRRRPAKAKQGRKRSRKPRAGRSRSSSSISDLPGSAVVEGKKRRATIETVAALAGVSIKTVSRVFNREPTVRDGTREEVLRAARELDYSPNLAARRLAANRSFVIGLLYDTPQSDYVTAIQQGSLQVCRRERYDLLIHPCSLDAPDVLEEIGVLTGSTVDGFLLTPPVSDFQPLLDLLTERDCRFVRVSQRADHCDAPCVSVDDEQAAREMADYLIELGHRRIGFIMGHPEHGSTHDRLRGYRSALAAHAIAEEAALLAQGEYTFESGYDAARILLALDRRPTAIFASNDHMALGVLRAAHESGLEIPAELSVCGFDDTPMASYAWPPLTTVLQPVQQVAMLATELLLGRLRGVDEIEHEYHLRSQLMRRLSTAPPPAAANVAATA